MRKPKIGNAIPDRPRLAWIAVLLVMCLGMYHHWHHPVLRFSSPAVNHAVFAMSMLLPGAALVLALGCRSGVLRILMSMGTLLACLPAAFFLMLSLMTLSDIASDNWTDGGFETIQVVSAGGSELRVYRTNGGAMTAFGIVVRQEMAIAPGVRLVRNVYSDYPADTVQVGAVTRRSAIIDADTVQLRPLVWF